MLSGPLWQTNCTKSAKNMKYIYTWRFPECFQCSDLIWMIYWWSTDPLLLMVYYILMMHWWHIDDILRYWYTYWGYTCDVLMIYWWCIDILVIYWDTDDIWIYWYWRYIDDILLCSLHLTFELLQYDGSVLIQVIRNTRVIIMYLLYYFSF